MKSFIAYLCGGLALVGTATARPAVVVSGKAYYDKNRLVLNVFADSVVQLRTFGILLSYNPNDVVEPTVFANDALWFFSAKVGQRAAYTPTQLSRSAVRIVGARFQGDDRSHGVSGQELLLATVTFMRVSANLPSFQLALAGPVNYASFVTVDGGNLDGSVDGLGTLALSMEPLPVDSDQDGIPDSVELAWFGNLTQANATSDTDGDGVKDVDEWLGGTDPKDPKSVTRLQLTLLPDGSRVLMWSGQNGRVYDILKSTDMKTFVPLAEGRTGTFSETVFDTVQFQQGFYQLRTHLPTAGH